MSLKEALLKAGFKSSKLENEREPKKIKDLKKSELHQRERNFCEICQTIQPDVERFIHKNALIDAQWICANCADKAEILDDFRVTHQSEFAIKGRYRRQYGPTKKFDKITKTFKKDPEKKGKKKFKTNKKTSHHKSSKFSKKILILKIRFQE